MCFGNLNATMRESHLKSYEVSPVEPLHDLKGHIRNVWEQLPHHLSPDVKQLFTEKLNLVLGKSYNYHIPYSKSSLIINVNKC